jgi:hypothetical protein
LEDMSGKIIEENMNTEANDLSTAACAI